MEEPGRSFYRKDYNPNKKYYFAAAAILTAALIISFLYFISGKNKGNRDVQAENISTRNTSATLPSDSEPGRSQTPSEPVPSPSPASSPDEIDSNPPVTRPGGQSGNHVQISVDKKLEVGPVKVSQVNELSRQQFIQAISYYIAAKYEKALPLFRELAADDSRMEFYIGACYYKMQNYVKALDYLETALDQNPEDFTTLKFLAFSYYQRNELQSSLERCEEALQIQKDTELVALQNRLNRELAALKGYGEAERVNFNIVFSKSEHSRARSVVIEYLEDAYRSVGRQIDFYPADSINVILYNEKNFFDVTRAPGWAGGLYDGKIRMPIGGFEGREEELKRVLEHEYVHALVHAITGNNRPPVWLNEGLAEYFSNDHGTKISQIIPLKYIDKRFPGSPTRLVVAAYVESYSAVSYLIDRYRIVSVKQCLEEMGKGNNWNDAFEKAFFITYDRFCDTWEKND